MVAHLTSVPFSSNTTGRCNLPSLQRRHVGIVRLKQATNMGTFCQEGRLFILVLCPSKEVSSISVRRVEQRNALDVDTPAWGVGERLRRQQKAKSAGYFHPCYVQGCLYVFFNVAIVLCCTVSVLFIIITSRKSAIDSALLFSWVIAVEPHHGTGITGVRPWSLCFDSFLRAFSRSRRVGSQSEGFTDMMDHTDHTKGAPLYV